VCRLSIVLMIFIMCAGCSTMDRAGAPPSSRLFIVFFVPGTVRLEADAQRIVREAAGMALESNISKIEIAIPRDAPGGAHLVEGRLTSIQNILSAAHVDAKLLTQADVSQDAARLPGASDRAEIRLLP
jgi:hypothetical protein